MKIQTNTDFYKYDDTTRQEAQKFSDFVEKELKLGNARDHSLDTHLQHIGSSEKVPGDVRYNPDTRGTRRERIELDGSLATNKSRADRLLTQLEKKTADLGKITDKKRYADTEKEIKKLKEDLSDLGTQSQKTAGRAIDEYNAHLSQVATDTDKAIKALTTHQDAALEGIEALKITPPVSKGKAAKVNAGSLKALGAIEAKVRLTNGDVYTVKNDGIYNSSGKKWPSEVLDEKVFREIKEKASRVIEDRMESKIKYLEQGMTEYEKVIGEKVAHLEEHQTFLAEKTNIGKGSDVKTPTKTSVGTALATEKGIIGADAYGKLGTMGKVGADLEANWKKGFAGKMQTAVGAIGVLDGLRRAWEGAKGMMSNDPEKQDQAGLGTLVVGLGETGLGLAFARMGGKDRATGVRV